MRKIQMVTTPPKGPVRIVSNLYVVKQSKVPTEFKDGEVRGYVCITSTKEGAIALSRSIPSIVWRRGEWDVTVTSTPRVIFIAGTDTMPDQIVELLY